MNFEVLKNVSKTINQAVEEKKLAGMNCLVFKDSNEVLYCDGGFSDIENRQVFKRDTICRLYSMTKPVTSVAAMILVERGDLDLLEEVGNYLPEFWNLKVCTKEDPQNFKKAQKNLLVKDLMNMTSGYTYGGWGTIGEKRTQILLEELDKDVETKALISTREFAKKLSEIPLNFEPGSEYCYGLSADILGAIIEKISGIKFGDFLKKNIFEPLEMNDTDFYVPEEKQNRLSKIYECNNGEIKEYLKGKYGIQYSMKLKPEFESGGAGLCSTIDDYMKFARMLCNGGELNGKRVLKRKTVEYLSSAKLTGDLQKDFERKMPHLPSYSYSNLLRVCQKPEEGSLLSTKGEFGWDGWLGPYVSVDLKNKLCIVCLMQRTDSGTTSTVRKIKNILYSSLTEI